MGPLRPTNDVRGSSMIKNYVKFWFTVFFFVFFQTYCGRIELKVELGNPPRKSQMRVSVKRKEKGKEREGTVGGFKQHCL